MAIRIATSQPQELLDQIKSLIDKGSIKSWSYDNDGDFTHTAQQWRFKAWFRPRVRGDELLLSILTQRGVPMSKATYGAYHGQLIETVLSHADTMCRSLMASSYPEPGDNISGK